MPHSLGARVTLVFAVGAAAALVLCLALLYLILSRQLVTALDDDLRARSADLVAAVAAGDVEVVVRDPLAQLYGPEGAVIAGSAALGDSRLLSPDGVHRVRAEELRTRLLARGEEAPTAVRVLSQRVGGDGVLSVAVSVEPLHEARRRLLEVLVLAAPLLVAVLAVAGWLVVRAALRPVDVLTREAAAISTFEAARGLPPVPGDDEIARLARTLDAMLRRLRVAFERERAFVDDASHELRTPIAVVLGELELALSAVDDPEEVERSLRAALGEAQRLSRLAEDLLLLARAQAGSLVIRREPADLLDLAVTEAGRLAPVLGARIQVSGEPATVVGDPDRLRQVLTNLARNSAAAGATTVRVRVARDQARAILEVADDGPGFPPGARDQAFERFVRGTGPRTPGGSGAGLGLSIVRAIVTAHGGTVEARNGDPLGGAVVTARLPLA
ncbi:HAMP domain-containing protein [Georgenia yuyongxinii]|uniref:histidine kinase n=1 Tax=Georgenia yuyongxinii TaxID=2589797 RepID=A0A5B8C125_9MICO|nr:ATP-binding protein [Georgenia yuyongxinii]QDC23797.1 HAMP domain-containing protein [Georgenia yuyongxinii]